MESCCVEEFLPSAEAEDIWGFTRAIEMVGGVSLVIFFSLCKGIQNDHHMESKQWCMVHYITTLYETSCCVGLLVTWWKVAKTSLWMCNFKNNFISNHLYSCWWWNITDNCLWAMTANCLCVALEIQSYIWTKMSFIRREQMFSSRSFWVIKPPETCYNIMPFANHLSLLVTLNQITKSDYCSDNLSLYELWIWVSDITVKSKLAHWSAKKLQFLKWPHKMCTMITFLV